MKIIVFGGTFNPPHLGHQLMAAQVLSTNLAAQVWLLPVGQHSFSKQSPYRVERLEMLSLLRQDLGRLRVDLLDRIQMNTYELDRDEESQTYRTLSALASLYPQHQFSFLIGSDNLTDFFKWHHYQELLRQFLVYVYPRTGFPMSPIKKGMIVLESMPQSSVSSTRVRQKIQNRGDLTNLLSPAMIEYLKQHQYMYRRS